MPSVSTSISGWLACGKPRLRRDRHRHLVGRDQDRLPELTVPGTELLLDALERGKLELGSVDEGSRWWRNPRRRCA